MDPKIKVSKHISSKLPDVFIQSRNPPKDRDKKNSQKLERQPLQKQKQKQKNQESDKHVSSRQNNDKKQSNNKRKSRNPFLNVRQYLKLSKEMDERMKEVRQQLQFDRFSQLHFQNAAGSADKQENKQHKLRYQDCLTLSLMKKTQASSLKKILHVPTCTVYFLRESLIDFSIDKNDLQQWIRKSNSETGSGSIRPQKIIQLYWNIPETYYSIIYQYAQGVLFDLLLQNTSILPVNFIQNLALTHLKADFLIFNSILLIKRNSQSQIRYLPVYEEVDDIIPQYRSYRELMKINSFEENQGIKKIQKIMVAKLGFLILVGLFSDAIIDQDIANLLFQTKDCCLFHRQMNNPNSLIKIYFQNNIGTPSQKQIISDFLCRILKFKPQQRASFTQLSKHRFFRTKFTSQICKMHEVIHMLYSAGSSQTSSKSQSRQLSMLKLNKIIGNMSLILQGASQKQRQRQKKQIQLSPANENIQYILQDLGLGNTQMEIKIYTNELINKFKRVYQM